MIEKLIYLESVDLVEFMGVKNTKLEDYPQPVSKIKNRRTRQLVESHGRR
ncbi:MAG: hypothetical protein QM786_11070 [Breznakibacter sp.]